MTNETKHTPTPWVIRAHDNYMPEEYGVNPIEIVDGNGEVVACNTPYYPTELKEKHAAHIVKCVNLHDELVEALRPIADMEIILGKPDDEDICFVSYGTIKKIKETLKKAGAL